MSVKSAWPQRPESILTRFLKWSAPVTSLPNRLMERIEGRIGHRRMPYLFLLPNMAIFLIFILLPVFLNFAFSLTGGDSALPENRTYIGLDNFQRLAQCKNYFDYHSCEEDFFWRAARNTTLFVFTEVPSMIVASLMVALALNRKIRFRGFFRSAFFYPVLLSPVVVALIWKWILQDRSGLIDTVLTRLGLGQISFLVDPNWMFFWVVFVSVWAQVGFYALILLAGLQSIPESLYEAARIDGADERQSLFRITLPLLRPTLLVVTVLTLIRGVQAFDHVYVLTGGGPGTATVMMVQYIYRTGFEFRNYGLAAAASLLMALVLAGLTIFRLIAERRNGEQADVA